MSDDEPQRKRIKPSGGSSGSHSSSSSTTTSLVISRLSCIKCGIPHPERGLLAHFLACSGRAQVKEKPSTLTSVPDVSLAAGPNIPNLEDGELELEIINLNRDGESDGDHLEESKNEDDEEAALEEEINQFDGAMLVEEDEQSDGVILNVNVHEVDRKIVMFLNKEENNMYMIDLLLFYKNGKSLSSTNKYYSPSQRLETVGGSHLQQVVPGRISGHSENPLRAAQKRFERCAGSPKITLIKLCVGPMKMFARNNSLSYLKVKVCFRDLEEMLTLWLNDPLLLRAGVYHKDPVILPEGLISGNYAQSSHFREMHTKITNKYTNKNVLVLPLGLWSDGVLIHSNRHAGGEAHPLLMRLLCASDSSDIRPFAFLNIGTEMAGAETRFSPLLRCQGMSLSLVNVLLQLKQIQENGGFFSKVWQQDVWVFPYLALYSGDLPELKRVFGTTHCPFGCKNQNGT
jgi:hypothetical protein